MTLQAQQIYKPHTHIYTKKIERTAAGLLAQSSQPLKRKKRSENNTHPLAQNKNEKTGTTLANGKINEQNQHTHTYTHTRTHAKKNDEHTRKRRVQKWASERGLVTGSTHQLGTPLTLHYTTTSHYRPPVAWRRRRPAARERVARGRKSREGKRMPGKVMERDVELLGERDATGEEIDVRGSVKRGNRSQGKWWKRTSCLEEGMLGERT